MHPDSPHPDGPPWVGVLLKSPLQHKIKTCPCHCSTAGGDLHFLLQMNLSNLVIMKQKKSKITMGKKEVPCEKPSVMENVFFDVKILCVCEK